MKLTEAQVRLLSEVAKHEGDLFRSFDVYGPKPDGYWWHWRQGLPVTRRTAEILTERKFIALSDETRPYGGRRIATASITDLGRAALAQQGSKP